MFITARAIALVSFFALLTTTKAVASRRDRPHKSCSGGVAAAFSHSTRRASCQCTFSPSAPCKRQAFGRENVFRTFWLSSYSSSNMNSNNNGWGVSSSSRRHTDLLPEAGYIKAARDEERLRIRREREVARAIGAVPWSTSGGVSRSDTRPAQMILGDNDNNNGINNENDNEKHAKNSNGARRIIGNHGNNGKATARISTQRVSRRRRSNNRTKSKQESKASERSYCNFFSRKNHESIMSSFSSVDDVDELTKMVDDLLTDGYDSNKPSRRLMSPREVTSLVRLLGARGAYDAMLKFVRHPASHPTVFSYTAACASIAQSSNTRYRSQSASLLDEMDQLEIQPNTYTFTALMLAVDGGADTLKMMERARQYADSVELNVFLFNSAIHACSRTPIKNTNDGISSTSRQNDGWQTALLLFRQMKKEKIRPNEQTYASLLHACGKSGQVKLALSFLNEMKTNPSINNPDAKVWGAVLQVLASAGDYKKAMKIMREMVVSDGISPNILHCNALLASLSKARKDDIALNLLECMVNGTVPDFIAANATVPGDVTMARADIISINTVLAACSKRANYEKASKILQRMKNNEFFGENWPIRPDIISYNSILSACHEPVEAERILAEMRLSRRERYSSVTPSHVTYTNAITVCRRADPPDLRRARLFLENAIREGVQPNVYMYSAVIWTAEQSGDPDAALALLEEMKSSAPSRHCKPNAVSYDGCISACAPQGRYKEAIRLLREMKDAGISPTPVSYKRLAIAISKANLVDAEICTILEPLVQEMHKDDRRATCAGPVLATLIRAFATVGLYNKAKNTFRLVRGPTDEGCLSAMLFACAKATKWQDALFFLHTSDIVANALNPGRISSVALTYASIACARANQWKEALNVIDLYGRFGENGDKAIISVNAVNALISACGRSGRADMAVKLLNEMPVRFQVVPDSQSYRFAIIACNQAEKRRQHGRRKGVTLVAKDSLQWWEVALSLLRRMSEDGLKPDAVCLSSVISACESAGQWQRALGVLRSMSVTTGGEIPTPPNLYCFNSAIAACEKGGAWLEAVELYERIKSSSRKIRPNFVTINSLLIALEEAGQREMSESIYREAIRDDVLSPWKYRAGENGARIRAIDLHQYSQPLAKVAVRTCLESLLGTRPQHNPKDDLVIIVGKGNRSEDGTRALRPVIQSLVDELGMRSHVPETNPGRIIIQSQDLVEFTERLSWRDFPDKT